MRTAAGILAAVMIILTAVSAGGHRPVQASESDDAMKKGYPGLCMDGVGYSSRSIRAGGDIYEETAGPLETGRNRALLYWAFVSNREDGAEAGQKYRTFRETVNRNIRETGSSLPPITSVSVADIKKLIHQDPQVAGRYPWLEAALGNPGEYLKLGLSEGQTAGKKSVPDPLSEAVSPEKAWVISGEPGPAGYTISIEDQTFINQAKIVFVSGGEGWSWTKGQGKITFWNTGGEEGAMAALDLSGSDYQAAGEYGNGEDLYENHMHWYTVTRCGGDHFFQGYQDGICPLEKHQRLYSAELPDVHGGMVYVKMGGGPSDGGADGPKIYRHEETFTSHYTIRGEKRDHETGEPLEGALFQILEAFPDGGRVQDEEGAGVLCRDNFSPSPAVWEGFRQCAALVTDREGCLSHTDTRTYEYSKTYCDGHPTPGFRRIPEKDRDPETGEVTNQGEIDRAKAFNISQASGWLNELNRCREREKEGTHFHWLIESGTEQAVHAVENTGEPCRTVAAVSGETAFVRSGCREDCEATHEAFVNLRYSYTVAEETARQGYTVHGQHEDDIPVEVITTNSSEAGAEAFFAGFCGKNETETNPAAGEEIVWLSQKAETGSQIDAAAKATLSAATQYRLPGKEPDFSEEDVIPADSGEELMPVRITISGDKEWAEEIEKEETATPSEGKPRAGRRFRRATPAELSGKESRTATAAEWGELILEDERTAAVDGLFSGDILATAAEAGIEGLSSSLSGSAPDGLSHLEKKRESGLVSHVFCIYDHRTEGEAHFNKRDLELYSQENGTYSSRGRSQGDGTMEGAVYGLFAAEDIVHPDGRTGIVYEKGNLTAVASTDKNGDGAFLVYTEAPGTIFSYETGTTEKTGFSGPDNLYHGGRWDDYPEDGGSGEKKTERVYGDNGKDNGNVWIGRPLILGRYEIRELSRSEGYELSVNGKTGTVTNFGASLETEEGKKAGRADLIRPLGEDVQRDESGYGELEFSVVSQGTGKEGYEILVRGYPEGTEFFREEEGTEQVRMEVGTGVWEQVLLWEDEAQTVPKYRRAASDSSDPVYRDGVPVTELRQMGRSGLRLPEGGESRLEEEAVLNAVRGEALEDGSGICRDDGKNSSVYTGTGIQNVYIKYKLEKALRTGGCDTPKDRDGRHSEENSPVYDRGIRKGETDYGGISGCCPGERAEKTVFGSAVTEVAVPAEETLTVGDMILTLISYYQEHPWWTYGGLENIHEEDGSWICTLYQSAAETGDGFFLGGGEPFQAEIIYWRKGWEPEDPEKCPRWVYAVYGTEEGAFGQIVQAKVEAAKTDGKTVRTVIAEITPDFTLTGEGELKPWLQEFPVYYRKGELVLGPDGKPEQDREYREITELREVERQSVRECRLPAVYDRETGEYRIQVSGEFTDSFGQFHRDDEPLQMNFCAVTVEREKCLTQADILGLTENWMNWQAGDRVGYGRYLLMSGAEVEIRLGGSRTEQQEENTYIQPVHLRYEDQEVPWEDGDTREKPVQVLERPIRQKIRIRKRIASHEDNTYPVEEPSSLPGFRFKIYLKSNLERLYRDENGTVVWVDRNGNPADPAAESPPEKIWEESAAVPVFYTRVSHRADSETVGPVSNNVWREAVHAGDRLYPFENGILQDEAEQGYVRLLEPADSGGQTCNYEKFFDAIRIANEEKWDGTGTSGGIRQFAIDWYLDEEVKKRTWENEWGELKPSGGQTGTQTEVHDLALQAAVEKAENYLKPFFAQDLDEIYAISWDSSQGGGEDGDPTTLSADRPDGSGCYEGISCYLPYGVYVAVEQQPESRELRQKHYEIQPPREIALPSVCGEDGSLSQAYFFDPEADARKQTADFHIRFGEEWKDGEKAEGGHVIRAHTGEGDFEVYKYGLAPSRLGGGDCLGYEISQSEYRPLKDIYMEENSSCRYHNERVGAHYPYGSLSECGGRKDGQAFMTGVLTAWENEYAPALVPWTITEPDFPSGGKSFEGYASELWENSLYRVFLRIEKEDRETGEMILHDSALFAVYRGTRKEGEGEQGEAEVYDKDTVVYGSREFLEAMGAEKIEPADGNGSERPDQYRGTVPAGTPVCQEEDQVYLTDERGEEKAEACVFSTAAEEIMPDKDTGSPGWRTQNTGYLRLPRPLGAGVYVIAELRSPDGYERSRPVAVEIYSDRVEYYQDGDPEQKVIGELYASEGGASGRDPADTVRISLTNRPVRFTVEKKKTSRERTETVLDGRVTGSITELKARYGLENLELAYNDSGRYLGYGWRKGFLEEMENWKRSGGGTELIYEDGVFSGRVRLSLPVEASDHENSWLPGAEMTLYEGIPLLETGDTEDLRYRGLKVLRAEDGRVCRMYVEKGYAGESLTLVKTEDGEQGEIRTAEWRTREDTDILYYDLAGLSVLWKKDGRYLGYGRNGEVKGLKNGESAFGLKDGRPFLEIICPDYERLRYNSADHVFDQVPEGTVFYHVDSDGHRDSLIDPYTGMAYVENPGGGVMVWPVRILQTEQGEVKAAEKIRTYRAAAVSDEEGNIFTAGTYDGGADRFLRKLGPVVDAHGLPVYYRKSGELYEKGRPVYDRDGELLWFRWDGALWQNNRNSYSIEIQEKLLRPEETLYRRQGEGFIMENTWKTGDLAVNDPFSEEIGEGQEDVLERIVPGFYILEEKAAPAGWEKAMPLAITVTEHGENQKIEVENSPTAVVFGKVDGTEAWKGAGSFSFDGISGAELALYPARRVYDREEGVFRWEKTSEQAFSWTALGGENKKRNVVAVWTSGKEPRMFQAIPAGTYLLEETKSPAGYIPASMAVEILPTGEPQYFSLKNDHTRTAFFKYEEKDGRAVPLKNRNRAELGLYPAETDGSGEVLTDWQGVPLYDKNRPVEVWKTEDCLEYTAAADLRQYGKKGVISQVLRWFQNLTGLGNDRYLTGFTWDYEKLFEEYGTDFDTVSWKEKRTAVRSSEEDRVWLSPEGGRIVTGEQEILFPEDMSLEDRNGFEKARKAGAEETEISWLTERQARLISSEETKKGERVVQLWETDSGDQIRIVSGGTGQRIYEYQFHYREFSPEPGTAAVSYNTADGRHHIERLPFCGQKGAGSGLYVLAEIGTPDGFLPAAPQLVKISETADVQLYSVKNERSRIWVGKKGEDGRPVEGALLGLYRAENQSGEEWEAPLLNEAELIATWRSGSDGRFTAEEEKRGEIPPGMEAGELKPHLVEGLKAGSYWLAELEAPPYYLPMGPVKVKVGERGGEVFYGTNRIKTGRIQVEKRSRSTDAPLAGAKFALTNEQTGEVRHLTTGKDGIASVSELPVGRAGEGGAVEPYTYRLKETVPPPGHEISMEPTEFVFQDSEDPVLDISLEVQDRETEIAVSKTDSQGGGHVKGAVMAVYRAVRGDRGMEADGEALEIWTSDGEPHRICGKLSAGGVYLVKELSAPKGYVPAEPLVFVLSEDGKGIASLGNTEGQILFLTEQGGLNIKERQPVSSRIQTEKQDSGQIWHIRETVLFSDGSRKTAASALCRDREDGEKEISLREPLYGEFVLTGEDGRRVERWKTDGEKKDISDGKKKDIRKIAGRSEEETDRLRGAGELELTEYTVFSDGSRQKTGRYVLRLNESGRLTELQIPNRQTEIRISKQAGDSGRELAGAFLTLVREDGTEVESWISGKEPHSVRGKLDPGETCVLKELRAPAGYALAEPMIVSMSGDEGELVIMTDDKRDGGDGGEHPPKEVPEEETSFPEEEGEVETRLERIGRIYAFYPADSRKIRSRLPGLGEPAGFLPAAGMAAGIFLLLLSCSRRKRK